MLHELQRQFLDGLLQQQENEPILQTIAETDGRSAQELLGIYRDSVFGGLSKALVAIYPVCCKLVGEAFFNAMATRFITQQPSTSPDLNDYGQELATFIASFAPAAALPYLSDVARLEWAWHRVFNAPDAPERNLQQLNKIPESQRQHIVFRLPPAAMLLQSTFPVHRIWEMNQDDYQGNECLSLDEGGIKLLIWRQDLTMHIEPVTDMQWALLNHIKRKTSLGCICEQLNEEFDTFDNGELLAAAIHRGWLVSFDA